MGFVPTNSFEPNMVLSYITVLHSCFPGSTVCSPNLVPPGPALGILTSLNWGLLNYRTTLTSLYCNSFTTFWGPRGHNPINQGFLSTCSVSLHREGYLDARATGLGVLFVLGSMLGLHEGQMVRIIHPLLYNIASCPPCENEGQTVQDIHS